MCGIGGEWNPRGAAHATLERMNERLAHRGPDDSGTVLLGEAGLAMRRLSIIDVTGGHQPIPNEDQTIWVVFNGEIYNHRELRRSLEARGHRFRTRTDTEVIVHGYEEKGERVVDDLRGMFAFAIWDAPRRKLLLARDRFGQKPLFYCLDGSRLLFASEIKAITATMHAKPELDIEALDDYLTLRFVPSPGTMFQGVHKLPPGCTLTLDASLAQPDSEPPVEVKHYWELRYSPKNGAKERDIVHEARERIRDSIESHLLSDVPLGAYLSGGMDSSLIVAMMSKIVDTPIRTFSVGVLEADFNEIPHARTVAEFCGTEHHEHVVSADLVQLLPKIVYHLDEPSDPIATCMYEAAGLAARHGKVVISGDGGDEVFAGFDRYFGFGWVGLYAALPAPLRRALLGPALQKLPDTGGYKNLTQRLRWIHDLSFHQGGRRYAEATSFFRFGQEGKAGLYTPGVKARLGGRDATDCIVHGFESAMADNDLDRMLQCDVVTRLTEHSLMLTDRLTMAHGVEARCPFLDHELAEFIATLQPRLKIKGRTLKYLMREVAKGLLPDSILRRPKQGFMFPLGYWMRGPLAPVAEFLLSDSELVRAEIFRADEIARLLREHLAGRTDHHVRLWMVLNVEIWFRLFILQQEVEDLAGLLSERVAASGGPSMSHA